MNIRAAIIAVSVALSATIIGWSGAVLAQRPIAPEVPIDPDDIGGVVTGPKGPEAGAGSSPKRRICQPNSGRSLSQTIPGGMSSLICLTGRIACGYAATD
jgi:hypothetical protein